MNMSAKFELVRRYYVDGYWDKARVHKAVECGWITAEEYAEIVGEEYTRK